MNNYSFFTLIKMVQVQKYFLKKFLLSPARPYKKDSRRNRSKGVGGILSILILTYVNTTLSKYKCTTPSYAVQTLVLGGGIFSVKKS